jgi:hypothetical protein
MIHDAVLTHLQTELAHRLITLVAEDDPARAGVVKIGPLQGDPDPDVARISVELYENDPDDEIKGSGVSTTGNEWKDSVEDIECGGSITWNRRFTIKARCLLETTQEDLAAARRIASTVRSRIEKALLQTTFSGVHSEDEYVARGPFSQDIAGEMYQSGGPPDAYDFGLKIRFSLLTTQKVEV